MVDRALCATYNGICSELSVFWCVLTARRVLRHFWADTCVTDTCTFTEANAAFRIIITGDMNEPFLSRFLQTDCELTFRSLNQTEL